MRHVAEWITARYHAQAMPFIEIPQPGVKTCIFVMRDHVQRERCLSGAVRETACTVDLEMEIL